MKEGKKKIADQRYGDKWRREEKGEARKDNKNIAVTMNIRYPPNAMRGRKARVCGRKS